MARKKNSNSNGYTPQKSTKQEPNVKRQGNPISAAPAKRPEIDFGLLQVRKMKIKQSEAVVYTSMDQAISQFANMSNDRIVDVVHGTDKEQIRELSKYFAQTNGLYARAVRYLSDIYKFDFMVYPNLDLNAELDEATNDKILKKFNDVLEHFDNSAIQLMARKWAAQVCLEGVYYGYICDDINDKLVIQDLPTNYCRSRFLHRGMPLIEFNVKYFEKVTTDENFRNRLLDLFPKEFKDGYLAYKKGKLEAETQGDEAGWIVLDVKRAFKFNFYDTDLPPFLYAIPALLELDEVQDLEKEKLLQQIQKILIQKFELDKNGQIPFTMKELQRLNQNAIDMVGDAVGVSVLSTVADVSLEDMSNDGQESLDSVQTAENTVYNNFGISDNLFNTDGNLALEKSITVDESYVKPLLLQFEQFLNNYIEWKFSKKELKFRLKMLTTTIFNYQTMSDKYKDLTKIGFSRFLPMVALGHTQKEVTSMAKLEQQIMELDNWMLPPFSSNTMSSDTWSDIKELQQQGGIQKADSTGGRPETPDEQKSEKTIANKESSN